MTHTPVLRLLRALILEDYFDIYYCVQHVHPFSERLV